MASKNHRMIRRHQFTKAILLAIGGSVGSIVLAPLVAWESIVPQSGVGSPGNQCLPLGKSTNACEAFPGVASLDKGHRERTEIQQRSQPPSRVGASGAEVLMFSALHGDKELFSAGESIRASGMQLVAFSGWDLLPERVLRSPLDQPQLANGETTLPELSPPLGIPSVPFPKGSPPTRGTIELGRQLFFDTRLSSDESTSCASCHNPELAFADNEVTSRRIDGRKGSRNTPALINAAFQPYQFWDGRASSLEDQALIPLENPVEMGSSVPMILDRLNQLTQYRDAFRRVFGSPVTRENLARALASFERTILAGDSAYDKYAAGNPSALSPKAAEGMKLFQGKAHCHLCHQGYNFSDGVFHNLGVGWDGSGFADEGRSAVTGVVKDRGAFKTPTLRQVAQTAPYMHDGSLANLEAVVDFYDRGGKPNPHRDPLIQPLRLTLQEKEALVEFLRSLSGTVSFYH